MLRSALATALAALIGGGCTPGSAASPTVAPPATSGITPSPTAASSTATPEPAAQPPRWRQLAGDGGGPSAREDHTWTVDGDGALAYLFGGRDGTTVLGDLWAFDLATDAWRRVEPAGAQPPARFGHEASWVDGIGLVIFAGQAGTTFYNDLWAFDPAAAEWRQLPAGGAVPVPRYGTCAAIGPDGRLWISHGFTAEGNRFADTIAYDFSTGAWTDVTPAGDLPVVRCLHGCWWTDDGGLRLYAGQTTGATALGDLWELRDGAWRRVPGPLPTERNLYAKARIERATLVFGGQGLDAGYVGGLWLFDDARDGAAEVTTVGAEPAGRAGAELVHDAARDRFLLFGGKDAAGALGDLWELTGQVRS